MIRLAGIFIYPVKGCRGLTLSNATVDSLGLVGDRRFVIVDPDGKFLSQRTLPRMALIETQLTADHLVLSLPDQPSLSVPRAAAHAPHLSVQVWSNSGLVAEDCGDEAAKWLEDFLAQPVRLVRIGEAFHRPVKPAKAQPGDIVSFADAYPLLVISEATLADLNARLVEPLPMNRFRPNLVVSGCEAYAEDTWQKFRMGEVVFRTAGPCARCVVTTTDQLTADRGKEPLSTLAQYRRDPEEPIKVNFGQNLIHETKSGTLSLGDELVLL